MEELQTQIGELEAARADDAPKVAAWNTFMDAEGLFSMEAVAKIGRIGRTTLYRRLREAGVIEQGHTMPYQRYLDWFKLTVTTWTDGSGVIHMNYTPRVTTNCLTKVLAKAGINIPADQGELTGVVA